MRYLTLNSKKLQKSRKEQKITAHALLANTLVGKQFQSRPVLQHLIDQALTSRRINLREYMI